MIATERLCLSSSSFSSFLRQHGNQADFVPQVWHLTSKLRTARQNYAIHGLRTDVKYLEFWDPRGVRVGEVGAGEFDAFIDDFLTRVRSLQFRRIGTKSQKGTRSSPCSDVFPRQESRSKGDRGEDPKEDVKRSLSTRTTRRMTQSAA
eukprot:586213-Rhodomonas_salina.1